MRDQVENHRVKQELEVEIEDMKKRRIFWLYKHSREEFLELKAERNKLKEEVRKLEQQFDPLKEKSANGKEELLLLKVKNKELEKMCSNFQCDIDRRENEYERHQNSVEEAKRSFNDLRKKEDKRLKDIEEYKNQISYFENQLKELEDTDPATIQNQISEITKRIQEISFNIQNMKHDIETAKFEKRSSHSQLSRLKEKQREIQDISNKRLDNLHYRNKNAYNAVQWLKNNRNKFNAAIHDPICTQINVKDDRFAPYVEDGIPNRDKYLFICEDKKDVNNFKRQMDNLGYRINIAYSDPNDLHNFKPPISLNQLRARGLNQFQCYLSDVIDVPPAIMVYLCRTCHFHTVPVALNGTLNDNIPHEIRNFYIGNSRYSRNKSRYDGEISTSIFEIEPASILIFSVDLAQLQKISVEITQAENDLQQIDHKIQNLISQQNEMEKQREQFRQDKKNITAKADTRKNFEIKIAHKRSLLQDCENDKTDLELGEKKMKKILKTIIDKKINVVEQCQVTIKKVIKIKEEHTKLILKGYQLKENIRKWDEEWAASTEQLTDKRVRRSVFYFTV